MSYKNFKIRQERKKGSTDEPTVVESVVDEPTVVESVVDEPTVVESVVDEIVAVKKNKKTKGVE